MKKGIIITVGIVGVLVGMGFVMPAVAQLHHEGSMTASSVALCLLGSVMTLGGITAAIRTATKRNA